MAKLKGGTRVYGNAFVDNTLQAAYFKGDGSQLVNLNAPQGLQGIQGPQGRQGIQGNFGRAGYVFAYTTSATPSQNGQIAFNNTNIALATSMRITYRDVYSVDHSAFLSSLTSVTSTTLTYKVYLIIQQPTVGKSLLVGISAYTTNSSGTTPQYLGFTASYISGDQSLTNLTDCTIVFYWPGRDGNPGNQGNQGIQGLSGQFVGKGDQGSQGVQGPQGRQGTQGLNGAFASQGIQGTAGAAGSGGTPNEADDLISLENTTQSATYPHKVIGGLLTVTNRANDLFNTWNASITDNNNVIKSIDPGFTDTTRSNLLLFATAAAPVFNQNAADGLGVNRPVDRRLVFSQSRNIGVAELMTWRPNNSNYMPMSTLIIPIRNYTASTITVSGSYSASSTVGSLNGYSVFTAAPNSTLYSTVSSITFTSIVASNATSSSTLSAGLSSMQFLPNRTTLLVCSSTMYYFDNNETNYMLNKVYALNTIFSSPGLQCDLRMLKSMQYGYAAGLFNTAAISPTYIWIQTALLYGDR